ncbi:MAG: hypothetical protein WBB66_06435 [Candidatus Omnitrophota bacterium]
MIDLGELYPGGATWITDSGIEEISAESKVEEIESFEPDKPVYRRGGTRRSFRHLMIFEKVRIEDRPEYILG